MKLTFCFIFFLIFLSGYVAGAKNCYSEYSCGEWSNCNEDSIQQRTCTDEKCGMDDIIERRFCQLSGCESDIQCSKWSSCNFVEKFEDVIEGKLGFVGYQERTCSDLNNCILDFSEERSCDSAVPVKIKKTTWCNEEYVEIFDVSTDKLVSRVKEAKIPNFLNLKRIDISFVSGGFGGYCSYCHNGVKDYDESDIDCGGSSCQECFEKVDFFDWAHFISIGLWGLFLLLAILLFMRKREIWEIEEYKSQGGLLLKTRKIIRAAKPGTPEEKMLERKIAEWFKYIFT